MTWVGEKMNVEHSTSNVEHRIEKQEIKGRE
jgi:hypothetical protein